LWDRRELAIRVSMMFIRLALYCSPAFQVLAAIVIACSSMRAQANSRPTEFYIVSEVTSDAAPFWYHYILQVAAAGRDSIVWYIRVAPMDSMCDEAMTVQAATARISGVAPSDLIAAYPLCDVDSSVIARKLRSKTRIAGIDDSVRFSIVARCGEREVALHLPFPENVNLERLKKTSPDLARWWSLWDAVKLRAFGSGKVFYNYSVQDEEELHREGESAVPELRSGRPSATKCAATQALWDLRGMPQGLFRRNNIDLFVTYLRPTPHSRCENEFRATLNSTSALIRRRALCKE
jgi:hypothetical protein